MLYKLQLTILITILIFIACGIISTFIFHRVSRYSTGKKLNIPFYRFVLAFTILGPFGLFTALGMYYIRGILGKCVDGNCFDGQGIKVYQNGDKYIGQWKNGKHSGMGTYYHSDGSFVYGQWKNGDCLKTEMKSTETKKANDKE